MAPRGQPSRSAVTVAQKPILSYSIKIVPKKKAEYVIKKLHNITKKFHSIEELKQAINESYREKVSLENFGYIEPGRGAKGKQRWLASAEDLEDMYRVHHGKEEILLWCNASDQASRKRAHSPDAEEESEGRKQAKSSRYEKFTDKMTEVEAIEAELRDRHADGIYSEFQLRSWAHLIQMKKHSSYDNPPDKPFWKTTQTSNSVTSGSTSASLILGCNEGSSSRDSPGKRINMRGKCMEQLMQLHKLFENGVVTMEQYEEMKSAIMGEVKKL